MSSPPPVNSGKSGATGVPEPPTELARTIVAAIRDGGPMTFREFMERALYAPGAGYYARPGSPWDDDAGDFVTGPQVHPAFGAAIGRLAEECDAALGSPLRFDLLECGSGDGTLLHDACAAIRALRPDLYERLAVTSVERGAGSLRRQRERLAEHAERVAWHRSLGEVADDALCGLVMSNELVDALPVHRVVQRGEVLRELLVDVVDEALVEVEADPSTGELAEYLAFNGVALADGQVAEVCLAATDWLAQVAAKLRAGCALTIDYGAASRSLYGEARPRGSLVCHHRYRLVDDPFVRIGEQDITAHVDFGNLRRAGARYGLEARGECSLGVFLVGFGAAAGAEMPAGRPRTGIRGGTRSAQREKGETASTGGKEAILRHLGLRHLLFSEIADAHRVLLQAKGLSASIAFGRDRLVR